MKCKPAPPILYGILDLKNGDVSYVYASKQSTLTGWEDEDDVDPDEIYPVEIKRIGKLKKTYEVIPLDD